MNGITRHMYVQEGERRHRAKKHEISGRNIVCGKFRNGSGVVFVQIKNIAKFFIISRHAIIVANK